MADISKCKGGDCPLKDKCYRYNAIPSDYQSYFQYPPYKIVNNHFICDYFWSEKSDSILNQLKNIMNE